MSPNILHLAEHDTRHLVVAAAADRLPESWRVGTPWPGCRFDWHDPEAWACHAAILTAGALGDIGYPFHADEVHAAAIACAEAAMDTPRVLPVFMQAVIDVTTKVLEQHMPSAGRIREIFELRRSAFENCFDERPRHLDADAIETLVGHVPRDPFALYAEIDARARLLGGLR